MRKRFTLSLFLSAVCMALLAVPATPDLITVTQPDGTTVQVHLVGDEFGSYYRALDGTPMIRNEAGFLEVDLNAPVLINKTRKARIKEHNESAGNSVFPTKGSPHSLVILVGFKDVKFQQKRSDFDELLNKEGYSYNGATGSCRDYYSASSFGVFTPYFDVVGPYTLENNMAFYGAQEGKNNDANPGAMVAEACQMAHADGVDFSQYDTNHDGLLDNVFIYYAGYNQAESGISETIWPHQSSIAHRNVVLDGVRVESYACTSEYRGGAGTVRCGIGTFCHEFGHVIGQPDFYDTGYNYYSVGDWDIMCSGSYNNQGRTPPTFTAYERFYEGWLTPEQLTDAGSYSLLPLESSNQAYLIASSEHNLLGTQPNPSEFFMLEYRDGNGWDSGLPGHGMLVWHIDYAASAWSSNNPNNGIGGVMRMHLEEANGITWQKRSNGDEGRASDPYPGTLHVTSFTPKLHDGTVLPYPLFEINEQSGVLSFTFIRSGSKNILVDQSNIALETTLNDSKKVVDWEPQAVNIMGSGLDPKKGVDISVSANSKNGVYKLYVGDNYPVQSSNKWVQSANLTVEEDSSMLHKVWISFLPGSNLKRFICGDDADDVVGGTLQARTEGAIATVALAGIAPRASKLSTPELDGKATNVTPNSFHISWTPADDAEMYYLSLYSKEKGESSIVQSFETFTSFEEIEMQGWQSSTTLTTNSAKADGVRALHLKENADYVVTEMYPVPVKSISYWVNAMATDVDTVGYIEVEAFDGTQWLKLTETTISKRTKNKVVSHEFEESAGYTRFRLVFYGKEGNGVAFDAFTATLSQKVNYIYQGDKLSVQPSFTSYTFGDLQPGTTYCYQVRCTDLGKSMYGGCADNLSPYSSLGEVTTIEIPEYLNDDKHLALAVDSINYSSATQVVYVSNPVKGGMLCIYDPNGALVYTIKTNAGVYEYAIPTERFVAGATYTIKYIEAGKMTRKQRHVKAIFTR